MHSFLQNSYPSNNNLCFTSTQIHTFYIINGPRIYQFREVDARKINPSKPDSLRLYTFDDISTCQFCTELFFFLPLIKDILDSIYKPLTFCK